MRHLNAQRAATAEYTKPGSFVVWCMSLDPITRWHPLRAYPSETEAIRDEAKMTDWTWKKRTRLRYTVRPAGDAPHA